MTSPRPDAPHPSRRSWTAPVLIALVALALVVVALTQTGRSPSAAAGTAPAAGQAGQDDGAQEDGAPEDGPAARVVEPEDEPEIDLARRDPADPLAVGPVDAPVVMVVYSDYQCPFCAVWSDRTLPAMEPYVEAGDLRIEWRDIAVFGPDSARAARAAYAAGLQGGFLDYHHGLFADGEKRSRDELSEESLVALADSLGLDADRFAQDLTSAEVDAAVQVNEDEAAAVGAFSTPSFLVGGTPLVGAQPTEVFVTAVEQALARAAG
ncbi:DsbA family protein [Cellulomonas carbonis]|uniref:Protein-disulfide isomerase n=1 Tax=Cellulomonas carbonis T26 TaxID=947969 RepID=A0A0A0BXX4_9CELL|nr:DsbA family protein [Cellulomonas carbonis]KGM12044.1 protein-disulfide isomerase [Cellulomonas carbonis T26]GGC08002.1 protein disulfide-isomerase [Cellulomonas carbonis]